MSKLSEYKKEKIQCSSCCKTVPREYYMHFRITYHDWGHLLCPKCMNRMQEEYKAFCTDIRH